MKTKKIKIETPNQAARKVRKTTKFEITMTIEVKDGGNVPANAATLSKAAITGVENIGCYDGSVKVVESHISQKTFPNGLSIEQRQANTKRFKAIQARRTLREFS